MLAILLYIIAIVTDAVERLFEFSRRYENTPAQLDELLVVLCFVALALTWFSFRRWQDLKRELHERQGLELQLSHQAFHDALTGLPNRALFVEHLDYALVRGREHGTAVALLFLDLDNFKVVNDRLGHAAGDRLLNVVADHLRAAVRPADTVARLGGDEFTVVLEGLTGLPEAVAVAQRLAARPITTDLDGQSVVTTVSIGMAFSPASRDAATELLRRADVALYAAKASGKACVQVFDPSMMLHAQTRLTEEAELRRVITDGGLRVYYQPIMHLATGRIEKVEALVRWSHPERGLLPPSEFIPLAEETGLIVPVGNFVLDEACRQMRAWQAESATEWTLILTVNLSARQFREPTLSQDIDRLLRTHDMPARLLELEIIESVAMNDIAGATTVLEDLKALGLRLAIDNFGIGHSSLAYLKRFPLDTIKIDRSFVDGLGREAEDTAIVRAVVAMARVLNLEVTAEGIETAGQLAELQALGCDHGQGFYLARPMPADEAAAFFAALPALLWA